jgi:hypothetical protein
MRKYYVFTALILTAMLFAYCHSSKKAMSAAVPKSTYQSAIETVIIANCSPCHIPAKGGNKKALDTYAGVKDNIDDIIARISLNPSDQGFMPFKHDKLPDSTIALIKQWKAEGELEK